MCFRLDRVNMAKQQLTPIPLDVKITKCPPGRAQGAALPEEYVAPSNDRRETIDNYWQMLYSL